MNKNLEKKRKLINEIIEVIIPLKDPERGSTNQFFRILYLTLENPQKATFVIQEQNIQVRYELYWTNKLDFELWRLARVKHLVPIATSLWFKVGRIIDRNYSHADLLKHLPEFAL